MTRNDTYIPGDGLRCATFLVAPSAHAAPNAVVNGRRGDKYLAVVYRPRQRSLAIQLASYHKPASVLSLGELK